MSFWDDFAKGFVPAFESSYDRGMAQQHEEKLMDKKLQASRRDKLLGVAGKVAAERAKRAPETTKFLNAQTALADRLRDEEGNLLPGSEALLSNPRTAASVLDRINEVEQKAAEDDNAYVPPMYGESIIENFTVYDSAKGRTAAPNVDVNELIFGIQSDEDITQEEYEQYYLDLNKAQPTDQPEPEPVIQMDPELVRKPDPKTREASREVYTAAILDLVDQDMAALKESDINRWTELNRLREDVVTNGVKSPSMGKLNDLYGAQAFGRLKELSKSDPTIMHIESDAMLERGRRNYYINNLTQIADDETLSQERRDTARRLLKTRFGVDY